MSETIPEFVLIWCYSPKTRDTSETLMILKDRPDWMAGRFNLPGGKIENGETPEEAARRELKEETGYDCLEDPVVMGKMVDGPFKVWILKAVIDGSPSDEPKPRDGETEIPVWMPWCEADNDKRLLPNLRVIVPLMRSGVKDFTISDSCKSVGNDYHSLTLTVRNEIH